MCGAAKGGLELLVLDGALDVGAEQLTEGSWLRLPDRADLSAKAGSQGAKVWIKTGHLPYAKAPTV